MLLFHPQRFGVLGSWWTDGNRKPREKRKSITGGGRTTGRLQRGSLAPECMSQARLQARWEESKSTLSRVNHQKARQKSLSCILKPPMPRGKPFCWLARFLFLFFKCREILALLQEGVRPAIFPHLEKDFLFLFFFFKKKGTAWLKRGKALFTHKRTRTPPHPEYRDLCQL